MTPYVQLFVVVLLLIAPSFLASPKTDIESGWVSGDGTRCACEDRADGSRKIQIMALEDEVGAKAIRNYVVNVVSHLTRLHSCTGALLEPDLVVVPASCVDETLPWHEAFPVLRVGVYAINEDEETELVEERETRLQIMHHNFSKAEEGFDIALLVLSKPVKGYDPIGANITRMDEVAGSCLYSLGWFRIGEMGVTPPLRGLKCTRPVSDEDCKQKGVGNTPSGTVCSEFGPNASCEWDTGALLLSPNPQGGDRFIGIASSRNPQCNEFSPYIYTHLAEFSHWIASRGEGQSVVLENPKYAMHEEL